MDSYIEELQKTENSNIYITEKERERERESELASWLTSKLSCSVDVVDEVPPPVRCEPYLPAIPQWLQLGGVHIKVPESRVVPRAHTSCPVDEVHLTLRGRTLLCRDQRSEGVLSQWYSGVVAKKFNAVLQKHLRLQGWHGGCSI